MKIKSRKISKDLRVRVEPGGNKTLTGTVSHLEYTVLTINFLRKVDLWLAPSESRALRDFLIKRHLP